MARFSGDVSPKFAGARAQVKRWAAEVSIVSLIAATLVGVGLASASTLAGPASVAHADPPPADPPTSITLATDEDSFAAGSSATLTSTTDEDIADTDSTVTITDETTSSVVKTCTSGTTCTVAASFLTGGAHTYVATVNDLTSNEVSVSRDEWTIALISSEATFSAGDDVTLTATANQDLGNTGGSYYLRIYDVTAGTWLKTCTTSTTCTYSSTALFSSGDPHTYVADVAEGDPWDGNEARSAETDVQASSNTATETRGAWTASLSSDKTTFDAGEEVTLTATVNQDLGASGAYYLRIYDETAGAWLKTCTTSTTCTYTSTALFYTGAAHTYIAEVAEGDPWDGDEARSAETDVQATSNPVTVARDEWSVSLTSNESTFAAGDSPALTSTSNQSLDATGGSYQVYIFDLTAGGQIGSCTSGSSCTKYTTFDTGGPHNYEAVVAAAYQSSVSDPSDLTDVQATSDEVTERPETWTISLTTNASTIAAGDYATLTATTNQDITETGGELKIFILDETDGTIVSSCYYASTSCSGDAQPFSGPPQTYVAVVAPYTDLGESYASITDAEATSNTVSVTREGWTLALTGSTSVFTAGGSELVQTRLTAVANQDTSRTEGTYQIVVVNYTTGAVIGSCSTAGTACTVSDVQDASAGPQSYIAYIAQYDMWDTPPYFDIQIASNSYTAAPIELASETQGGPNSAENYCGCSHGDPVNTATGEFYLSATDDEIPGVGPSDSVGRTYSTEDSTTNGPFGYGWSASFSAQLVVLESGDTADPLPRQVLITQENGSTVQFTENGDQTYSAPPRVFATLTYDSSTDLWTYTRQQRQVMVFDSSGALTASKDLQGNTVAYGYTSGNVTSVTGSGGRWIDLTWSGGHVTGLTDSAGRSVTYTYDGSDNLASVTAVDATVSSYGYDSDHLLTTIVKPNGGTTTNVYDSSDRAVAQTDPDDRVTTFDYSGDTTYTVDPDSNVTVETFSNGLLTSQTKAAGNSYAETSSYTYDPANNLSSITDPLGKVTSYTYDANGDMLTQTDPLDRTTTWTYDGLGDVLSVTDPLSRVEASTYSSTGEKLSSTSPGGQVQHWTYNTDGTVATVEDARGETTSYGYNSVGDQTSSTDPDARTQSVVYNSAGIVTSTTDAGGNVTTVTSDAVGRALTTTDANGHTTTYGYDGDGNRTSVENAGGHTTTNVYDAADQLTSTTVPGDHTTSYTYSRTGLLETTTDPNSHATTLAYDALGAVSSSTDPDGNVTHYGYDGDGRPSSETLPSGDESTVTYDDAGQKVSSTDAAGKTTTYVYDDDGELTSTTDPLGRVTSATYTADAQLHTVTLPGSSTETSTYNADGQTTDFENADGQHTTYSYDDAGQLTSKSEPGPVTTGYSYNTAGLLDVTTNPDASTVTDSYDAGGLLTGVAYSASSGSDVSYTYDADNLRTGMTDATGTSSYGHDSRGLMTSETNGAGTTIGYGYDGASQLTSITYPGDKTVTYGYDGAGQMTSLTDSASNETSFTWTADGQLATQADPNGVTQTRSYDADDRTTGISTATGSTPLADYTYGYDDDSELTSDSTTDPNNSTPLTQTYSYDTLSQLTTVDDGPTSPSYTNTPGGEVTGNTAGSTLAYNAADELTSVTPGAGPSTTFGYDADGDRTSSTIGATETTSATTTSYGFDPAGNLASVAIPATGSSSAETVGYTSDGDGLRQTRTIGTTTTDFLWDTNSSLPLLLDDGTNSYLYGPSSAPIAEVNDSTGTIRYLTADLIGSTRLVTSSTGTVVGVNIYDEYGNLTSHTGTATSAIGYSGNWTDPDTGLVYLRARDYDPTTAQFLTVDPLVDSTRQPYAYVADDPMANTDSTGLSCDVDIQLADRHHTTPDLSGWGQLTQVVANLAAIGVSLYDEDGQQVLDVASVALPETAVGALMATRYFYSMAIERVLDYTATGLPATTAARYTISQIASGIGSAAKSVGSGASAVARTIGAGASSAAKGTLNAVKSIASRLRPSSTDQPESDTPSTPADPESSPDTGITSRAGSDELLGETEAVEDDPWG